MSECNNCEGESQNKNLKGPRGRRGEVGPQGPVGPASGSVIGPQGPQGDPGNNGLNGAPGLSAYQVWLMLPGNAGKTEAQFITAITGATGTPPNFVVGTVTAGATPGVTAVTVGTTCTLNFVLAQGPTGPSGGPGPAGIQGNPAPNSLVYNRNATSSAQGGWNDNTGNYETATVININKTSLLGYTGVPATALNAEDWNSGILVDSFIQITARLDSTKFGIYKVVSIFDNTSFMTYTVVKIAANGSSATIGEEVTISYTIPGNSALSTASVTIPVGAIWPTGTKNTKALPTGWLLCDGSPYAIATYPDLFAEIGTTYAQPGDPLTVFRVPDLIDTIPYGCADGNVGVLVGNNSLSLPVTGSTTVALSGTATVNIDASNLPAHTHGVTGLSVSGGGEHTHLVQGRESGTDVSETNGGANINRGNTSVLNTGMINQNDGSHTHSISGSIDSAGTAGTTQASGSISGTGTGSISGTAAGDNRQKGLSLRFMIKF